MNTEVKTAPKPAKAKEAKKPAVKLVAKTKASAKPVAEKVARPAKAQVPTHNFTTSWSQPSTVLNQRSSRTAIALSAFGTQLQAPLTDRDRKSMADLRAKFKNAAFTRSNVDAGILRRLGERGYLEHVSGSDVAPDAQFKLTKRAFTPEAMVS